MNVPPVAEFLETFGRVPHAERDLSSSCMVADNQEQYGRPLINLA